MKLEVCFPLICWLPSRKRSHGTHRKEKLKSSIRKGRRTVRGHKIGWHNSCFLFVDTSKLLVWRSCKYISLFIDSIIYVIQCPRGGRVPSKRNGGTNIPVVFFVLSSSGNHFSWWHLEVAWINPSDQGLPGYLAGLWMWKWCVGSCGIEALQRW